MKYIITMRKKSFVAVAVFAVLLTLSLMTSCTGMKETAKEIAIESIFDSKTGEQVFVREYDTKPYGINVGGLIKARKQQKKQKVKKTLEDY